MEFLNTGELAQHKCQPLDYSTVVDSPSDITQVMPRGTSQATSHLHHSRKPGNLRMLEPDITQNSSLKLPLSSTNTIKQLINF